MSSDVREFSVLPAEAGLRLDVWLERRLAPLSRARVQTLLRDGHILLEGRPAKAHRPVRPGQTARVQLPPPAPAALAAQPIPLAVLYEDADIIVIDKPAGLVVHPAAGHADGTLVNALLHHCPDLAGIGGERRPGIVHRLDRDTSGVMVAAKHDAAMRALVAQFQQGGVRKEYVALVHGTPRPSAGTVATLIGRSPHDRKKMSARPGRGRAAVTHYRVAEMLGPYARLDVRIETGRTHQIRVHLAHLGHPVVGDAVYGRRTRVPGADRQMLHAQVLAFTHPGTGAACEFRAPMPPDMTALLNAWRADGFS